jgi:arylformamidase
VFIPKRPILTIYDISLTLSPALPIWPSHLPYAISRARDIERGDRSNVSYLQMTAHTGTHVDAPLHFMPGGRSVEALDLNVLVGPALVVEAQEAEVIDARLLAALDLPAEATRLLFHTRNSGCWARGEPDFREDYVALDASGAQWVVDHGVRLVGVDYLSVATFHDAVTPHRILLGAGVIPVEGLNLTGIEAGEYQLACLPLKIGGGDGAPCRAVLMRE